MDRKLHSLLSEHRATIADRWYEKILDTYPDETAKFLRREGDQIANPVGQNIAAATQVVVAELLNDEPTEELTSALDRIVRIRAIQEFTPARALGFVFELKGVLREVLAGMGVEQSLRSFEERVDGLAMQAVEIYVGCKQQMHDIRIKELKARTFKLVERMNRAPARGQERDDGCAEGEAGALGGAKKK